MTEHHLEFLSLKGGWTGSSESTLVKIPHFLEITCRGSYVDDNSDKICHKWWKKVKAFQAAR